MRKTINYLSIVLASFFSTMSICIASPLNLELGAPETYIGRFMPQLRSGGGTAIDIYGQSAGPLFHKVMFGYFEDVIANGSFPENNKTNLAIQRNLANSFSGIKGEVRFVGLSANGKEIQIQIVYKDNAFKKYLASGSDTLEILSRLRLVQCDGNSPIVNPIAQRGISEIVAHINKTEIQNFLKCEFESVGTVVGDEIPKNIKTINPKITINRNGAFVVVMPDGDFDKTMFSYQRQQTAQLPEADRKRTLDGAKTFLSILKDYSNTLVMMLGLTPIEREQAVKSFIDANRVAILSAFKDLNQGFAKLNFADKLAITSSINMAYSDVSEVEFVVLRGVYLDRVFKP